MAIEIYSITPDASSHTIRACGQNDFIPFSRPPRYREKDCGGEPETSSMILHLLARRGGESMLFKKKVKNVKVCGIIILSIEFRFRF